MRRVSIGKARCVESGEHRFLMRDRVYTLYVDLDEIEKGWPFVVYTSKRQIGGWSPTRFKFVDPADAGAAP